ncbi:MAG: helix-turn-helix domain-containing protein [Eubacteriales bacterium]
MISNIRDYDQVTYFDFDEDPMIHQSSKSDAIPVDLMPDSIPAGWENRIPQTIGFHMHENIEVNMVTSGQILYIVDRRTYVLRPGDILLIGCYIPHTWIIGPGSDIATMELVFHGSLLEEGNSLLRDTPSFIAARTGGIYHIPADKSERAAALLRHMQDEYDNDRSGKRFSLQLMLYQFLLEFIRAEDDSILRSIESIHPTVKGAQTYIREHLAEHPAVADIATAVSVTPNYLSSLFRKHTGIGISDYINTMRIEKTVKLLQNSNIPISEVARTSGFTSVSNFYRVFSEYYGISPLKMRQYFSESSVKAMAKTKKN